LIFANTFSIGFRGAGEVELRHRDEVAANRETGKILERSVTAMGRDTIGAARRETGGGQQRHRRRADEDLVPLRHHPTRSQDLTRFYVRTLD
jgi:hypothetical protein